jgi:hypothetical protein
MNFFIKQNSSLPSLIMRAVNDYRYDNDEFFQLMELSAVTFSMSDVKTGRLKVASKPGRLIKKPTIDNSLEYYIAYDFSEMDTNTAGVFLGEFKVTLFNSDLTYNSSLIVPIAEDLYIHVIDSFVKSDLTR